MISNLENKFAAETNARDEVPTPGCYQAFLFDTLFVTFAQFGRRFKALRRQPISQSNAGADARLQALKLWVEGIDAATGSIAPASGDASFRRYFRLQQGNESFIVMDAPPPQEDQGTFGTSLADKLRAALDNKG